MPLFEDPGEEMFGEYNMSKLGVDQAYLTLTANSVPIWVYKKSSICYDCPYSLFWASQGSVSSTEIVNSQHSLELSVRSSDRSDIVQVSDTTDEICRNKVSVGQFGVYTFEAANACILEQKKEPVNIYWGLLVTFLFFFVVWIAAHLLYKCIKRFNKVNDSEKSVPTVRKRLKSLDTVRGLAIILMIFVNDQAGGYYFFGHAVWDGLYVADLVFPWFLWIMDVCMPLSFRSLMRKNTPLRKLFLKVLVRSIKLFFIGVILNSVGGYSHWKLENYRIMNVLQRFGISYFVVGTVYLIFSCQVSKTIEKQENKMSSMADVVALWPQWIVMLLIEAGHLCIIFLVDVPGCGQGYLGPGGLADKAEYPGHCIGGATGYLDSMILGKSHIYQNPTAKSVYNSEAFDPEGLIGCLPTIFQVFLGVQAGMILLCYDRDSSRIRRWIIWSGITGLLGASLCLFSLRGGPIPINKNLWSLSYVFVTTGMGYFLLSIFYFLVDVKEWWSGSPLFQAEMNSILLYVGHFIGFTLFPWHWQFGLWNTHWHRIIECMWSTSLWVVVAIYLYSQEIFLKI